MKSFGLIFVRDNPANRDVHEEAGSPLGEKLYALERYLANCGLEKSLLELVKLRASQTNGCAYCLDMHSKDALAAGETLQRLVALDGWREAPFYTDRNEQRWPGARP